MQAVTGHRIYCVVGHLKYREYACVPSALYLQHPVTACTWDSDTGQRCRMYCCAAEHWSAGGSASACPQ